MDRTIFFASGALALLLGACSQQPGQPTGPDDAVASAAPASPRATDTPMPVNTPEPGATSSGDGMNDGVPDLTPAPLTTEAERTAKGARNVLLSWARAIELREFDQAWAMMSKADQAKWPKAEWTEMFADLATLTVAVPDGTMEGAAGSSYYTNPATITARTRDGRPVRYEGSVVLRRVNDVPGATAAQLRWHIESVSLDWTH